MRLINKIQESIDDTNIIFEKKGITTFVNPYSYYLLRKNYKITDDMENILVDGILFVLLLKVFNIKVKRYSFDMTSIAPKLFNYCIKNNKTIYFIGAKEDEIGSCINVFRNSFKELKIAGHRYGYFSSESDYNEVICEIKGLNPDFVVCGMGTPLQEQVLIDLANIGWNGIGYTCGGFLHQTAQGIQYYPKWADRWNIRAIYRMYDEPKLIKRYFIEYPIAIILILRDLIIFRITCLLLKKKSN